MPPRKPISPAVAATRPAGTLREASATTTLRPNFLFAATVGKVRWFREAVGGSRHQTSNVRERC